jgi:uncharacterized protein YkwD
MSDTMTIFAGEPQPRGTLQIARPRLFWRIWPDVTGVVLRLNGELVDARYDRERRAVVGLPARALKSGHYRVDCVVTFRGGGTTRKEWDFDVSVPAATPAPRLQAPREAHEAVNRIRQRLGLSILRLDPALQAAASAHARYLLKNRVGGHLQSPGRPGFLAVDPAARARAFGFVEDTLVEDVAVQTSGASAGSLRASSAVAGLFDAPYHRLPFLNPTLTQLGTAYESASGGRYAVLLFGGLEDPQRTSQVVVSPFDGEGDVPVGWRGRETPDPLRLHEHVPGAAVGYPLVFAHFPARPPARQPVPIRLDGASLTGPDGRGVRLLINDPRTDPELGGQAVVLLPAQPLQPGTTYVARVSARDGAGKSIARTWHFTTRRG